MKIAVVTRMLRKDKLEGFGVFTHELFLRIVQQHPEHEFLFLFDRPFDKEFIYAENVKPFIISPPARHVTLLAFWYQVRLKQFLKKHKPSILISPDGAIPLNCSTPTLSVIHDLNFEHFPEDMPFFVRNYYRYYYHSIAKGATRLATVSEFSKQDLEKTYHVDPTKIDVVYNGVSSTYKPLSAGEISETRKKYSQDEPYFLFVGSIHQRKNLPNMMKAFTEFRKKSSRNFKFIIAGAKRWWNEEMENAFEKSEFKNDILFIGRVNDEELPKLFASAHALLFVSKFEGFGIPIIESMKCEVPVITSTTTSMPEVAGNAALLANPDSVDAISEAMKRISDDESLRKNLSTKGIERAKEFSWDESSRQLWKVIEKTVSR